MRVTKQVTISIMPELLERVEVIAKEEHRTRSALLREALRSYLLRKEYLKLSQYGQMKAKELGIETEDDVARLIEEYRNEQMNAQNSD